MNTHETIRAEKAERAALADIHLSASPELRDNLGLELTEIGGALTSIARHYPTILVNRVVGLGLVDAADRETVEMIVERYREAGVGRYFLQLDPAAIPEMLPEWLEDGGLEPYHRAWAKFRRGAEPAPAARSDLEVREIGAGHAGDFGRIAAAGFELDDAWIPALAGMVGREGGTFT